MSDEKNHKTLEFKEDLALSKIRLSAIFFFFKSVRFFHPNSHHHLPENSSEVSRRSLRNCRRGRKEVLTKAQTHTLTGASRCAFTLGLFRFRFPLAPAAPGLALAQRTRPRGLNGPLQNPSCLNSLRE